MKWIQIFDMFYECFVDFQLHLEDKILGMADQYGNMVISDELRNY